MDVDEEEEIRKVAASLDRLHLNINYLQYVRQVIGIILFILLAATLIYLNFDLLQTQSVQPD